MPALERPVVYTLGALVVVLVGVLGVKSALSRTPMQNDIAVACFDRVKELETEVRALREQLRVQSARQINAGASVARSPSSAGAGHRITNGRLPTESCAPPFSFDDHGIKNFKPTCLGSDDLNSCEIPYQYTSSGIKLYKPNCLEQAPSVAVCNPPFEFDAKGVKTFKPACL
jgi:hypothetical protein